MNIYKKVKDACSESDISVMELERQLGFSRGSILKWDDNIPSVERVKKVADRLNKPIEYFLE
jgi:transcriptional regulator with XRE-family HTH domain